MAMMGKPKCAVFALMMCLGMFSGSPASAEAEGPSVEATTLPLAAYMQMSDRELLARIARAADAFCIEANNMRAGIAEGRQDLLERRKRLVQDGKTEQDVFGAVVKPLCAD